MKFITTLLLSILISGGSLFAQGATSTSGAKIEFEKTVHDFGANPQGVPVTYDFVFRNTGDEPLVLQSVKASCGCTTPNWPREPIMPGQESNITVKYNMARAGNFTKTITVTVKPKEAEQTPEIVKLTIKGSATEQAPENSVEEVKPNLITNPN